MMELQIIIPRGADLTSALDHGLVVLTEAICQATGAETGFGLGGRYGYGENYENDVFAMRRFYWGDCDCGADERGDKWHEENPHKEDCFQQVLHSRFAKYDEESGYNAIDAASHGPDTFETTVVETEFGTLQTTDRTELGAELHAKWCSAHDARREAHDKLTAELYDEFSLPRSPYIWHCTCGVDKLASKYFAAEGHYPSCALELPNFKHKKSGLEVRWYKWIGRDTEVRNAEGVDLQAVFSECLASLATTPPAEGETK